MTKKQLRKMGINPDDFEIILEDQDLIYDPYELVTTNELDDEEE